MEGILNPNSEKYATDKSDAISIIREAGFNIIGITIMCCEETFIFSTPEEAENAYEYFEENIEQNFSNHRYMPDGWWYGLIDFQIERMKYVLDIYDGVDSEAPKIYWL